MKRRRKVYIGRIIMAFVIYIAVGLIPLGFLNNRANKAKSDLAKTLLYEEYYYPEKTREILLRSSKDSSYAGKHIHVWDPDGRGYRPYDTFIGGGRNWEADGFIIPQTGSETAEVILNNSTTNIILGFVAFLWYFGVPVAIAYMLLQDDEEEEQ